MRNYSVAGITIIIIVSIHFHIEAQRQLVLVSRRNIINRFMEGETFRTKWRDDKKEHWGFIVEINEFAIVTSQDTINLNDIKQVLLPGKPLINKIGKTLITIGVVYLFIDQFNWVVVQGHDPSMDDSVWKPASILVGAGIPLLFFNKKWIRIKRGVHLVSVDKDSRLYSPDY